MTDFRTIYVVTEGEYDQRREICAYETEADAQTANTAGVGDGYFEVHLMAPGAVPPRTLVYVAAQHPTMGEVYCREEQAWPWEVPATAVEVHRPPGGWLWWVRSLDRDTALAEARRIIEGKPA